ncbi:hypothetical protein DCS_07273 [Drechmeria coniospora]|uniref:Uncharacterized protein n=1 Tax=Drechmeria coniospora TaxID=98403 RepID=A0A151GDY9_DRECN|nr:hypothetical protein DCS_07273 [Drechmeria coniospora]KYK55310.1 hypothetical protein DCS_07273 [Drechmeria coniospora]
MTMPPVRPSDSAKGRREKMSIGRPTASPALYFSSISLTLLRCLFPLAPYPTRLPSSAFTPFGRPSLDDSFHSFDSATVDAKQAAVLHSRSLADVRELVDETKSHLENCYDARSGHLDDDENTAIMKSIATLGMLAAAVTASVPRHQYFSRTNMTLSGAGESALGAGETALGASETALGANETALGAGEPTTSAGETTPGAGQTTLTVLATKVYSVVSCAPSVTNCPAQKSVIDSLPESEKALHFVTSVYALSTTVCPVTDASRIESSISSDHSLTPVVNASSPTLGPENPPIVPETPATTDDTPRTLSYTLGSGTRASVTTAVIGNKHGRPFPPPRPTPQSSDESTTTRTRTSYATRTVARPYLIPDSGRPDGGNPDGGNPDGGIPNGGNPNGGNPDGGIPIGGRPNGGRPDGGNPDGSNTDGGIPNGGNPNGGNPDGGIPIGGRPNGGRPDVGNPDGGNPDGSNTDGGIPNGGNPNGGNPDGGIPIGGRPKGGSPQGCDGQCPPPSTVTVTLPASTVYVTACPSPNPADGGKKSGFEADNNLGGQGSNENGYTNGNQETGSQGGPEADNTSGNKGGFETDNEIGDESGNGSPEGPPSPAGPFPSGYNSTYYPAGRNGTHPGSARPSGLPTRRRCAKRSHSGPAKFATGSD